MKHSTSSTHFGGIPIDTNTLNGQWITFTHMANHYRKLLGVKPRVDTGIQGHGNRNHFTTSSAVAMQSSTKSKTKMGSSSSKQKRQTHSNTAANNQVKLYQDKKNSYLFSSHPDQLNASGKTSMKELINKQPQERPLKSSSRHNTSSHLQFLQFPDYQVVFGPSSIRSSTDAFMSDETESTMSNDNKPPSEIQAPIGVTEKIRRFLNHIHQLDLTPVKSSSSSAKKKGKAKGVSTQKAISTTSGVTVSAKKSSAALTIPSSCTGIDFRLDRHSKCFLPWEPPSSPRTPRKSPRSVINTSLRNEEKPLSSPNISFNRKPAKNSTSLQQQSCDQLRGKEPELIRNRHTGSVRDIRLMVPEKDAQIKKTGQNRKRAGSIASIGTVCGSDELTTEDFPMSLRDICATLENGIMGDDSHNDHLLSRIMDDNLYLTKKEMLFAKAHASEHHYSQSNRRPNTASSSLLKSNSMTSLTPSGSGYNGVTRKSKAIAGGVPTSKTESGVQGNGNNKDSSRDSAYGFSSGESRITTRESTPEKKCLSGLEGKSHKHYQRERDLQHKPCKDGKSKGASYSEKHSKPAKEHRHLRTSKKDDVPKGVHTSRTRIATNLLRQDSPETYITLLTELTQDIVSQGIYTNKGLKTLFKSYQDRHHNLDQDKLADMLERLRIDLGIPKDDALDKIEFGYGSITQASSTTYFYTASKPADKLSSDDYLNSTAQSMVIPPPPESLQSDSPSPTTIIPIPEADTPAATTTTGFSSSGGPNTSSNRSTTTTDEGSGDMDDNDNYKHHDIFEGIDMVKDAEDELSLSETEVTQALKIAGLDEYTMEELVGILKS